MHTRSATILPFTLPFTKIAIIACTSSTLGLAAAPWAFADLPLKTLASFNITNGFAPTGPASVTLDSNGNLFDTTAEGGLSYGTVFEVAKNSNTITDVASFTTTGARYPQGGIAIDSSGDLFGVTEDNALGDHGTVFEILSGSSSIKTLASFNGANGDSPSSGITLDSAGNIYGATQKGGAKGNGTIFEVAKGSTVITDLASLNAKVNGNFPPAGPALDSAGNLFGTTINGGTSGDGLVFEVAKGSGSITALASFTGSNGYQPQAGVTLDNAGDIFGTTYTGGANNDGTVFEIIHGSTTITDLASFNGTDGENPGANITLDSAGNIFSTTEQGGANNEGTVFEIVHGSNTITDLVSFNGTNGAEPAAGVALDSSGNLFGSTYGGGTNQDGTVFEIPNADASAAPEPPQTAALGLTLTGLAVLLGRTRRRAGKNEAEVIPK